MVIGIICGYAGSFLIWVSSECIIWKRGTQLPLFKNQFSYVSLAAIVISSMTFFHASFWYGVKGLLNDLFTEESLSESTTWGEGDTVLWMLGTSF